MLYVFESVQYRSWRKLCLRACAFLILRTRTGMHRYTTAAISRRKCILELANDVSSVKGQTFCQRPPQNLHLNSLTETARLHMIKKHLRNCQVAVDQRPQARTLFDAHFACAICADAHLINHLYSTGKPSWILHGLAGLHYEIIKKRTTTGICCINMCDEFDVIELTPPMVGPELSPAILPPLPNQRTKHCDHS